MFVVPYAFVVFVMRVPGRRELSSLGAVDLVLLIVLGDAIQQGLTQDDYSLTGAVIAVSTIGLAQIASASLTFRWRFARKIVEGPRGRDADAAERVVRRGAMGDPREQRPGEVREEVAARYIPFRSARTKPSTTRKKKTAATATGLAAEEPKSTMTAPLHRSGWNEIACQQTAAAGIPRRSEPRSERRPAAGKTLVAITL